MSQLDRVGAFIGTIEESAFSTTSKGLPQWVGRLKATKMYIDDAANMQHFGITEPGYVDWSTYNETILAYLVLFNDRGPLRNYEQLMTATGWTGQDFQDLGDLVGKSVLFRTEEDTYDGKTSIKVQWLDAPDAPPTRTLKSAALDVVKDMNAKFLAALKKPVAPAKPMVAVAAKAAVAVPKPAGVVVAPTMVVVAAPETAAVNEPAKKPVAPIRKKMASPAAVTENPAPSQPAEVTKEEAWEFLNSPAVRGDTDEGAIAEAWIAACAEVGSDVDEEKFTQKMWGNVRNIVIKDLALNK